MTVRVGQGVDVHAFGEGDHVMIGGVRIPHSQGVVAHSDGDVLIHAVCDALLGASALGDIGKHFPDTDPVWRGADSRLLLRRVVGMIEERNYTVANVDAAVIVQAPKLAPYIESMRANIAADLEIDMERVNVKATTSEKLGFTGRGEGIAAFASVLVQQMI